MLELYNSLKLHRNIIEKREDIICTWFFNDDFVLYSISIYPILETKDSIILSSPLH